MAEIEDRLDYETIRIGVVAKSICAERGFSRLFPEVYAYAMLACGPNSVVRAIDALRGNLRLIKDACQAAMRDREAVYITGVGSCFTVSVDGSCRAMSQYADEARIACGASRVSLIHMLVGIMRSTPSIRDAFQEGGVPLGAIENALRKAGRRQQQQQQAESEGSASHREADHATPAPPKAKAGEQSSTKELAPFEAFCTDLTERASAGQLDPVFGRDVEIERVIATLCRKKKNNPLLIGGPGIGKTAIVEGLAQRMVSGNVPSAIVGRRIMSLNLTAVVAGTQYRGQFEERMQNLLEAVRKNTDVIMFVDEAHLLVGAGSAQGSLDASNVLKPALARGEFCCIAATTEAEYRKSFQADKALDRRFQRIRVDEPSLEETIRILKELRPAYENHHSCIITDEAIDAAVELSGRHVVDRFFPDKAIDAMDEACARHSGSGTKMTREHIAKSVADQIGAPLATVLPTDAQRERAVVDELTKRVFGQPQVIEAVGRVIRRAFSPLRDPHRPLASLVFGGPSSTGKSFVAQIISDQIYTRTPIVRLNMAEFSEGHSVSRLLGAPPGYVGFGDGNQFADKVRRHPHSVVLLENLDKAHPDVLHMLMEMLETGRLTDAEGNDVNFCSTVIIMTTVLGSDESSRESLGFGATKQTKSSGLEKAIRQALGDEFATRVDEFVPFLPLSTAALRQVAVAGIEEIERRSGRVKIQVDDGVLDLLEKEASARNVRATIKSKIEPILCDIITDKTSLVRILVKDGQYAAEAQS